jgi:hypothetical protein
MARSIVVQIIGDAAQLEREFKRAGDATDKFGKRMGVSLKSMGKAGLAGVAVGGTALVTQQLFKSVQAAKEAEKSEMRLGQALDSVKAKEKQRAQAMAAVNKVSRQAGLDDEELSDTLANMTRATGDVTKAQKGMALAAQIARGRNVSLSVAAKAVEKTMLGSDTALKRLGVTVPKTSKNYDALKTRVKALQDESKTATKQRKEQIKVEIDAIKEQYKSAKAMDKQADAQSALAKATKQFAGSSERYGKTAAGAQDRLNVAFENLQERVGAKLLPVLTKLALWGVRFMDWSEKNWPKFRQTVTEVFRKIQPWIEAFGKILRGQFKIVKNVVETIAALLQGDWSKAWKNAKQVVTEGVAEIVKEALKLPAKIVRALASASWNGLKAVGTKIKDAALAGLAGLADAIIDRVKRIVNRLIGIINAAISKFNKIPAVPNIPKIAKLETGGAAGGASSTKRTSPGQVQPGTRPSGPRDNFITRSPSSVQNNTIIVNGAKNPEETGRAVLRHIQRTNQNTATPRRGPNGGTALATG